LKLSLVITTYNSPAALEKVTDSILVQTRLPDEVFIADDGSGEDTFTIVENFSKVAPFPVFHVWHEHKGFRAARIRNESIKQTSGDYIILLDGDCIANRHFVSDHLFLAEKGYFIQGKRVFVNKDAVKIFNREYANSALTLIRMALRGKISNIHHLIRFPFHISVKNKNLRGVKSCNMSFFRRDILVVNGFNEDFVGWGDEDSELAWRFFRYGLAKKVNPFMTICFHLWHPTNKTISNSNRQLLAATIESEEFYCKNGIVKKN
jgi:glycosyltransferase involved in cell wall biosynthesis